MCTVENNFMIKTLLIDLDGTVALLPAGSRDFVNAVPNEPLIAKLKLFKHMGYKLVLCSARGDKRRGNNPFDSVALEVMKEISDWLNKTSLIYLFDEIVVGKKQYAELYIDDKGICPEAFMLGIDTADAWAKFSKSAMFKQCVLNWLNKDENTIYLNL